MATRERKDFAKILSRRARPGWPRGGEGEGNFDGLCTITKLFSQARGKKTPSPDLDPDREAEMDRKAMELAAKLAGNLPEVFTYLISFLMF